MKKLTPLFLTLLIASCTFAQKTQLTFDVGAAYHPDNYFYDNLSNSGFSIRDSWEVLPIFSAQLGARHFMPKCNWFYEGQIRYGYTQFNIDMDGLTFPNQIDDYYGFVKESNQEPGKYRKQYHSAGLNLGAGYRWQKNDTKAIVLPIGFSTHTNFLRRTVAITDDEKSSTTYTDNAFDSWLYYGFYSRPSFEFSLSNKPSPWTFALFAELNVLWNARENGSTKFIAGGGLGVRYSLTN